MNKNKTNDGDFSVSITKYLTHPLDRLSLLTTCQQTVDTSTWSLMPRIGLLVLGIFFSIMPIL